MRRAEVELEEGTKQLSGQNFVSLVQGYSLCLSCYESCTRTELSLLSGGALHCSHIGCM
jgi:hypothetical protein